MLIKCSLLKVFIRYVHTGVHVRIYNVDGTKAQHNVSIYYIVHTYCPLLQFPIHTCKPGNNFPVLPSVIAQFECACTQPSFAIEML